MLLSTGNGPTIYNPGPVHPVNINAVFGGVAGMGATGTEIGTRITSAAGNIAGANAGSIAGTLGVAVPVVGAAIAGITLAITMWLNRKGPKQKRWTTDIVNEMEPLLKQNVDAWKQSEPSPINQAAALDNFDRFWGAVLQGCGDPAMGKPGVNCISERQRGGSAPWCPTGTGCDWFILYRDPIANDPRVQEYAAQQQAVRAADPLGIGINWGGEAVAGTGVSLSTVAWGGAALIGLMFFMGDN
jgi:hypothetical protein